MELQDHAATAATIIVALIGRDALSQGNACSTPLRIYVRSQAAGERVMASVVAFLEGKLRLKVNRAKSAVAALMERSFLGYRLLPGGRLGLAPKSLDRVKETLRRITRRNRGISLERMVGELNGFTTGWVTYFLHAACKSALTDIDDRLRRELRCVRLKQCKRVKPL
jgi:RNA-directed DNA polymerase